jgi:hypothetical protein
LYDCSVVNTSREGFGVKLSRKLIQRLRKSKRIELRFRGEFWRVETVVGSEFNEDSRSTTIGLVRIEELTKLKLDRVIGLPSAPKFSSDTDPSFVFAMVIAFLALCVCLPGIGTQLGTEPRVKKSVSAVIRSFREALP